MERANAEAAIRKGPSQRDLAARVVHAVIAGLETGIFSPGQRLVEADLCLRCAVGRQPVRIALQELRALGVADLIPNRGAVIVRLSVADAAKTLEVTEVLLDLAARSAAQNVARGGSPSRLANALAEMRAAADGAGADAFVTARRHFYTAVDACADNPELSRLIGQVRVHVLRAQFGFASLWRRHADELRAVGRAILDGDVELAGRLSRAHVIGVRRHLESFE